MVIPRKEDLRELVGIPKGAIKDTKRAVVFATLGLPLDPVTGILVLCSAGGNRMDGEAHYNFNVSLDTWDRVNEIYSSAKADVELDSMLERLKNDPAFASIGTELERRISDALIVYGRAFLENYSRMIQCLMSKGKDIRIEEKNSGSGAYKFIFFLDRPR